MRDDDDDDLDQDEDDYRRRSPRFPATVKAAGIIWIIVGSLGMISGLLNLVNGAANQAQAGAQAGGPGFQAGYTAGIWCAFAIAIAFVVFGYQTVTGKASDTVGGSVASIMLGLVYAGIGTLAFFGAGMMGMAKNKDPNAAAGAGVVALVAIVLLLIGFVLLLAAVLGFVGRRDYLDWKEASSPRRRRRPRRRVVEEVDEDEE
jgi:hypothetical protein